MPNCLELQNAQHISAGGALRQRGFTLVEIAVVLVVIGLLIGGILQGQSILQSMRVKDIVVIARDLSTAAAAFKSRYHYLPGDWPFTANEIANVTSGGNGNGSIGTSAESANVPNHLFNAGFIRGGIGAIQSDYGSVRVVGNTGSAGSVVAAGPNPVPATVLNVIEFSNLPCDVAKEVDMKLDDGDLATGSARGSVATCVAGDIVAALATPL